MINEYKENGVFPCVWLRVRFGFFGTETATGKLPPADCPAGVTQDLVFSPAWRWHPRFCTPEGFPEEASTSKLGWHARPG